MENDHREDVRVERAATTEALPVSPSMGPSLEAANVPQRGSLVDRRVVYIAMLSMILAVFASLAAEGLMRLIWLVTNISFYGVASTHNSPPTTEHLGAWVMVVPVIGGLIVGVLARYGSAAIRGHGIPEAMEQVLTNQSRIPARLTFLKPLSAAIAIGTGGPFGAEGPIIATGGAAGSLLGQILSVTATERKTLLAAGAAAGMAATFGAPVSAVLLAIELLLFEFRPRSFVPVALASVTAAGMRFAFGDQYPVFHLPVLSRPGGIAMICYLLIGVLVGFASIAVTRSIYLVEDAFEKLPIHWMWWPAIGAIPVGVIGYFCPRTLGVGYDNISALLSNSWTLKFVLLLGILKFVSWSIALGSGTSGGTLAPLFTIGSALGALLGAAAAHMLPGHGIDIRVAALVGMAAMFAGASRALLASVVFAFETTLQPLGLLPLLGGCTGAFLVSCLFMPNTIMTEKMARRGVRVPTEYGADFFEQILVGIIATRNVVTVAAGKTVGEIRVWMRSKEPGSHFEGFPVVDESGKLVGVITRRDLDRVEGDGKTIGQVVREPVTYAFADSTLREATDLMVRHDIGRLPVVDSSDGGKVVGIVTRTDLLRAEKKRLEEEVIGRGRMRVQKEGD